MSDVVNVMLTADASTLPARSETEPAGSVSVYDVVRSRSAYVNDTLFIFTTGAMSVVSRVALLVSVATVPSLTFTPSLKSIITLPVGTTSVEPSAGTMLASLGACVSSARIFTYFRL